VQSISQKFKKCYIQFKIYFFGFLNHYLRHRLTWPKVFLLTLTTYHSIVGEIYKFNLFVSSLSMFPKFHRIKKSSQEKVVMWVGGGGLLLRKVCITKFLLKLLACIWRFILRQYLCWCSLSLSENCMYNCTPKNLFVKSPF
jgi:hypothetical protein